MYYIMITLILSDIMVRSKINIISNNLLINIPISLIIIKLNLVNNALSGLVLIEFS